MMRPLVYIVNQVTLLNDSEDNNFAYRAEIISIEMCKWLLLNLSLYIRKSSVKTCSFRISVKH